MQGGTARRGAWHSKQGSQVCPSRKMNKNTSHLTERLEQNIGTACSYCPEWPFLEPFPAGKGGWFTLGKATEVSHLLLLFALPNARRKCDSGALWKREIWPCIVAEAQNRSFNMEALRGAFTPHSEQYPHNLLADCSCPFQP